MPLTWKLIGIGIVLAAIGGILAHNHYLSRKYQATKAELVQANATITAEREVRKIEQDDRRRADESAKSLEAELARIRSQPPITGVRCRTIKPKSADESGTSASSNGAPAGSVEGVPESDPLGPEIDVSVGLDWYGTKCEEVAATLRELQSWESARTH
jgi:hypothetical protein